MALLRIKIQSRILRTPHHPNQKRQVLALLTLGLAFVALLIVPAVGIRPATAQLSEPTAIIDRVLLDLGTRLGVTLDRVKVQSYTWEQQFFPDSSLGCPDPSQSYTQGRTAGFLITIRYKDQTYDYRAAIDGSYVVQCVGGRPSAAVAPNPNAPTATPGSLLPPATGTGLTRTTQPTTYNNPLAFVAGDGNVYVADFTARTITTATALTGDASGQPSNAYPYFERKHNYINLVWSPDGKNLAFADNVSGQLFLVRSGQKATGVAAGVATEFPPSWSADGGELFYAVSTGQPAKTADPSAVGPVMYQIQAVPVTGGAPRAVGQFAHGTGCGGGGYDNAYAAYQNEAGYNGIAKTLAQVPNGFLYTLTCLGTGTGLSNLTEQGTWQRTDLSGLVLSPDRSKAAAIVRSSVTAPGESGSAVEMVDLKTGSSAPLPSTANPTQLGWSSDGLTLFYATLTPAGTLIIGDKNADVAKTLFPEVPFNAPLYTAELWRLPVAGGQPVKIYSREGRGIANITTTADGASVVFTFVTSLSAQADILAKGGTAEQALKVAPRPEIIVLPLNGGAPYKIVDGGLPAVMRGLFTALPTEVVEPPPPLAGNGAPTNLVIGSKAVVSVKEGSLNLRAQPSTNGTVIRFLPIGTVVTIVAGPTVADGYRWWQVTVPSGNTGWVVDQVVENGQTINTLTPQ